MKRIVLILFMLFFVSFCEARTEITVLKVYDGDTILARIDETNSVFRIRLVDIDCFEGTKSSRAIYQAKKHGLKVDEVVLRGNLAGDILRKELDNKKVYFEFMGMDKYNRALGVLYTQKENINKKMLKTTYCEPYNY